MSGKKLNLSKLSPKTREVFNSLSPQDQQQLLKDIGMDPPEDPELVKQDIINWVNSNKKKNN